MTGLFIASKRVEHDGSRRIVATGAVIGDDVRIRAWGGDADALAAAVIAGRMRRELAEAEAEAEAGIEAVKRAGREAWQQHHGGAS